MVRTSTRLLLQPVALAIVLALVARAYVRIYSVPSASMEPTLEAGDHIVAVPYGTTEPGRGDVVVFQHQDELLVKRIVGTPGDLIETRGGRLFVSGHAAAEPWVPDPAASGAISPQIIPAGCYFVMGDNRGDSFDSRAWGVLPRDLISGHVQMVLWSSGGQAPHRATLAAASTVHASRFFRLVR